MDKIDSARELILLLFGLPSVLCIAFALLRMIADAREEARQEKRQEIEDQKRREKEGAAYDAYLERRKMSVSLRYDILKRDNFRCVICGRTADDGVKLHVDHIKPVSRGGKTVPENLRTLCADCNIGKSNKE